MSLSLQTESRPEGIICRNKSGVIVGFIVYQTDSGKWRADPASRRLPPHDLASLEAAEFYILAAYADQVGAG